VEDDLLVLAGELARREKGRPKQVSLRRAAATAYYAVFHALAHMCADSLVGWTHPWSAYSPIYRALDHHATRKLFESDRTGRIFGSDVAEIGRVVLLLQEVRQLADYDPKPFPYGRQETLEFVDRAARAIQIIGAFPKETRLLLAANLVTKRR
jgi:hypothetical protein